MKILIAEDDRISRNFLQKFMQTYGEVDVAVDGMEAVDLYMDSIKNNSPYDLLCLDIMMPKVDGLKVLKVIRQLVWAMLTRLSVRAVMLMPPSLWIRTRWRMS